MIFTIRPRVAIGQFLAVIAAIAVTVHVLSLCFFPTAAYSRPTDADLAKAMSQHLTCYPVQRISMEDPEIAINQKDLCLAMVYQGTGTEPLWVTAAGPVARAQIILDHLLNSYKHGLDPKEYKVDRLLELWHSENAEELAELDTTLTYSVVRYVHDVSYGRMQPHEADPALFAEEGSNDFNPSFTVSQILAAENLNHFFDSLPPRHQEYTNLMAALERYRQLTAEGGWPRLGDGPSLRPGDKDPRIITVRQRLKITEDFQGDPPVTDPELYDSALEQAVLRFQRRHGLAADGVIGKNTRAAMNVTAEERVNTIRVNMARWRWQAHDLGTKHILVNIASFNLKAYRGDTEAPVLDIPVIVGEEQHQTPVFSDSIAYLDFNPFWNITPSIAENEELPALRKNPGNLSKRHVRLFSSWQTDAIELNPDTIDWHSVSTSRMRGFKLRQDPGPWNALGKIKFVFPNKYSVYMHDTPAPSLFKRSERSFSHGCIRVSDPLALAIFVLDSQNGGWEKEKVMELYNQDSRKVIRLSQPVPVHITYLTSWVDKDGTINFNRDIYERDEKLFNALYR